MEKQILEIIKEKDDWKFTVEIKENAKGEAQVSVKTRSDGTTTCSLPAAAAIQIVNF